MKKVVIAILLEVLVIGGLLLLPDQTPEARLQRCIADEPTDTRCDSCWFVVYGEWPEAENSVTIKN